MTQIRTAEEILSKYSYTELFDDGDKESAIEAMQEYAKQFIDLAAEEAKALPVTYNKFTCQDVIVDVTSILKIKDLIK
jgi:hypothetical protein